MSWLSSLWQDAQFEGALWQGLFQLVALTIAAAFGTFVFQRVRARQVARQVLIDEIDDFTTQLYKPRKLYQIFHENGDALLAEIDDPLQRRARRNAVLLQALEELIAVTGRFRSLQVKLVPLYGYNTELFAYYLAIWSYLKEIRRRMEARESLLFHHESPRSVDAFYRLIDAFRYRVSISRYITRPPGLLRPPHHLLEHMRSEGARIFHEYFQQDGREPILAGVPEKDRAAER